MNTASNSSAIVHGKLPLSLEQVAQLSGVAAPDLLGLIDYGVLTPAVPGATPLTFNLECVLELQRADHLRQDLALDSHGFALAMMLLGRITGLEAQLSRMVGAASQHGITVPAPGSGLSRAEAPEWPAT